MSNSFARLGKFSFIICSNKFSISYSSSSSGTPIIWTLEHLKLSQRFLSLSSFFWILLSSVCLGWIFISSFWSKLLIFPSCHCWFPEYFVLFHFGSPSFVLSFFNQPQSVLWALWLPVFLTLHQIGWLSSHHLALFLEFCSVGPRFLVSAHRSSWSGWLFL